MRSRRTTHFAVTTALVVTLVTVVACSTASVPPEDDTSNAGPVPAGRGSFTPLDGAADAQDATTTDAIADASSIDAGADAVQTGTSSVRGAGDDLTDAFAGGMSTRGLDEAAATFPGVQLGNFDFDF